MNDRVIHYLCLVIALEWVPETREEYRKTYGRNNECSLPSGQPMELRQHTLIHLWTQYPSRNSLHFSTTM